MDNNSEQTRQTTAKKSRSGKLAAILLALFLVFGAGYLSGNGRLQFGQSSPLTLNSNEDFDTGDLQEIYNKLAENYDGKFEVEDLEEGLKKGFVAAVGDTYTEYLSPADTEDFNSSLNGTFEGIGAELGKEGNFVVIVAPIKGAPAEKAGLQPQDIILEIEGEDATDISISEAVKLIRGEKGTSVSLTLLRDGERVNATITRDTIDIPSVEWNVEDGVGTIAISRFGDDTTQLVRKAAGEFKEKNVNNVILDMRGNPGGLLDAAVGVSDVFLKKGAVVLEEKQNDVVTRSFISENDPILPDAKVIVLINEGSASASEIVAGALKDNDRATLVGETSYGKGSVQQLLNLRNGGSLKVTIARWYTPNNKNIDKEGITPDEKIDLTKEDIDANRDPQLDKAKSLLK